MAGSNTLKAGSSAFVVVDVQEAFRTVIPEFDKLVSRLTTAVKAFGLLDVPMLVTEQYPKGLGKTVADIASILAGNSGAIEKTTFSSCGAAGFFNRLDELGARQVIVGGLETHICVNQTVHDLLERGFQVHVLGDCVKSRYEYDRLAGMSKMIRSGAIESSLEMAIFEVMRDAKHPRFREIQALIK